jgi:cobalt-precorrin 5A hydrolase/precorrin-3B C17-methyltransferase
MWVGIGCQRGTSQELIEMAIKKVFQENQLEESAIAGIATIDTKASEVGLVEFCRNRLPLKTFSADILRSVDVPHPSSIIEKEVSTPSVAEAAALCAILDDAADVKPVLVVTKQIFRSPIPNQTGAVTVAVAVATYGKLAEGVVAEAVTACDSIQLL